MTVARLPDGCPREGWFNGLSGDGRFARVIHSVTVTARVRGLRSNVQGLTLPAKALNVFPASVFGPAARVITVFTTA